MIMKIEFYLHGKEAGEIYQKGGWKAIVKSYNEEGLRFGLTSEYIIHFYTENGGYWVDYITISEQECRELWDATESALCFDDEFDSFDDDFRDDDFNDL